MKLMNNYEPRHGMRGYNGQERVTVNELLERDLAKANVNPINHELKEMKIDFEIDGDPYITVQALKERDQLENIPRSNAVDMDNITDQSRRIFREMGLLPPAQNSEAALNIADTPSVISDDNETPSIEVMDIISQPLPSNVEKSKGKERRGKEKRVISRLGRAGMAAAGIAAALVVSIGIGAATESAPAHAAKSVSVFTDGAGNPSGERLKNEWAPLSPTRNNQANHYPAQISPAIGAKTLAESNLSGEDNGNAIIAASGATGRDIHNFGYSQGSIVAAENAKSHPGSELTVAGSPHNPEGGFFDSWKAKLAGPALRAFGIDINKGSLPSARGRKVTSYEKTQDIWASGGAKDENGKNEVNLIGNVMQVADSYVGDGHSYSRRDMMNPNNTRRALADGTVVVHVQDNHVNGFGEIAKRNGLQWSAEANDLTNRIGGFSGDGQSVHQSSLDEMAHSAVNLANSVMRDNRVPVQLPNVQVSAPRRAAAAPARGPVRVTPPKMNRTPTLKDTANNLISRFAPQLPRIR